MFQGISKWSQFQFPVVLNLELEVAALIDPIRKDWNDALVRQLFLPFEADRVLRIPLSCRLPADSLCWDLEKDGVYSVRSAYKALVVDVWSEDAGPVSTTSDVWKVICATVVLPRVKLFAWRACLEALPTRSGLHVRIQTFEAGCALCGAVEETGLHALYCCGLARSVWELSSLSSVVPEECCNMVEWWGLCFEKMAQEDVESFLTLTWAIWGARCRVIMEGESCDPVSILAYAKKVEQEVRDAASSEEVRGSRLAAGHPTIWSKPATGWCKINVDAGLLGEWGSGLRLVCRDEDGVVKGCAVWQQGVSWDVRIAEAKAVLAGVKWGAAHGVSKLVVESDCLAVIQALKKGVSGASDFSLVVEDILSLISSFISVEWSFVKRSGNKVAHYLAHFQPVDLGWRSWDDDVPMDVINIALDDINA